MKIISLVGKKKTIFERQIFSILFSRLKGLLDKDDQESEVIKDSPDSPEPLNKKPRLATDEVQPQERAKGTHACHTPISPVF